MAEIHHTDLWNWKEKEYKFDIYLSEEFPPMEEIKQVYSFVLSKDKQKVLLVYHKSGMWQLPGGTVEQGESVVDTMVREVKEETNRDIQVDSIHPFFFQSSYEKGEDGEWMNTGYQVRSLVFVENDNEFISDPDEGKIIKTEWVPICEIDEYLQWQNTTTMIKEHIQDYVDKM